MPSDVELALRILLAMGLGGAIGLEREYHDKTAGLRTHISVALGACLFGLVSAYGFDFFGDRPREGSSYQVDVSRVASTVVTGIGFLGGGAILKHGATVRGLTTAGSLWVTAAIGLAVGLGLYFVSAVTTAALLVALAVLRYPSRWLEARVMKGRKRVTFVLVPGAAPSGVIDELHRLPGVTVRSLSTHRAENAVVVEAMLVAGVAHDLDRLLSPLAGRPDVDAAELG